MQPFICFFLPSAVSMLFEEKKLSYYELIRNYLIYVLLNNFLTVFLMITLFKITYNVGESVTLYPAVFLKYALVSFVISILLGYVKLIFCRNIGVQIEEKKISKNN